MTKLRTAAISLTLLSAGIAFTACSGGNDKNGADATPKQTEILKQGQKPGHTDAVYTLTADSLYTPGGAVDRLTVLDFNAVWCGPCRMLAPVFHESAKHYADNATFVSVDIDSFPETAKAFGVKGVPTVVIIQPDGKSATYVGTSELLPAEKFDGLIQQALK